MKLTTFVLSMSDKDLSNIAALIGDKLCIKKSLEVLCEYVFVCFSSHSFNLSVKYMLNEHYNLIVVITKIIDKLLLLIPEGRNR